MNASTKAPVVTTLLSTRFFDVIDVNDGTRPTGQGYKIIKEPKPINGVVVVPVLPDGRVVLASLMRRAIGQMSIEFPRGKIDDDETPVEAAVRELLEETGMVALQTTELGMLHSNTSLLASAVSVCKVQVSGEVSGETDGEVENVMIKTLKEVQHMILSGEITDGHTLSALTMLSCHSDT
ncbi:NUDIX domain-containing protein [Pseudomonas syringae]|uniref:NUDIX hydrolase n=1 Tax=Pseudomonas syringae TaxID=317 RepID=UPI001F2611FF|nr:NUDIX hydrolase [Pseudomonas syringae]MCF5706411.1 NUDIX domain-containing protein [Pseudomonas syringae]